MSENMMSAGQREEDLHDKYETSHNGGWGQDAAEDLSSIEKVVKGKREDFKGGKSVLVVDDDELIRSTLEKLLLNLGHRVDLADDGEKALEMIERKQGFFRLLITDVMMPGINGLDLIKRLCERGILPEQGAIVMSGNNGADGILGMRGVRGFLQKPFSLLQLGSVVNEILRGGE